MLEFKGNNEANFLEAIFFPHINGLRFNDGGSCNANFVIGVHATNANEILRFIKKDAAIGLNLINSQCRSSLKQCHKKVLFIEF